MSGDDRLQQTLEAAQVALAQPGWRLGELEVRAGPPGALVAFFTRANRPGTRFGSLWPVRIDWGEDDAEENWPPLEWAILWASQIDEEFSSRQPLPDPDADGIVWVQTDIGGSWVG